MRSEGEIFLDEAAPHRNDLVGLAGVGVEQVLEERIGGSRDVAIGNGDVVVVHGKPYQLSVFSCQLSVKTEKAGPSTPVAATSARDDNLNFAREIIRRTTIARSICRSKN